MAANVGHIVALVVFAGAVAVLDLRMAGAFAATSPGDVLSRARRVVDAGFSCGSSPPAAVLFTAEASHVDHESRVSGQARADRARPLNVALFEIFTAPQVRELPPLAPLPAARQARRDRVDRDLARGRGLRAEHCVF